MENKQYLTKEEFNQLNYIEKQLYSGWKSGYAIGVGKKEIDLIATTLKSHNIHLRVNYGCNVCKLNLIKALAPLYFDTKEYLESEPKNTSDVQTTKDDTKAVENENKPQKKGGRKKKTQ